MLSLEWRYTVKKDKEGWKRKQMEKKESWLEKKASKICGLNKKPYLCSVKIKTGVLIGKLGYGVMVTQQILVLFFQVRILVVQHEAFLMEREAFFMRGGWFRDDVQTAFFPSQGFCKKIFHLSGYIVSLLKQVYCVLKDVPAIFQPKLSPSLWRTGKGLP